MIKNQASPDSMKLDFGREFALRRGLEYLLFGHRFTGDEIKQTLAAMQRSDKGLKPNNARALADVLEQVVLKRVA